MGQSPLGPIHSGCWMRKSSWMCCRGRVELLAEGENRQIIDGGGVVLHGFLVLLSASPSTPDHALDKTLLLCT